MERLNHDKWYSGFFWGFLAGWLLVNAYHVNTAGAAMPPKRIEPEHDITTTTLLVHWYDSEEDLGLSLQDDTLAGFSECELRPDFNTSFCELWLVRPTDLEDSYNFDTIGHELYHALAGDFHE
jgi:hypothetical protein